MADRMGERDEMTFRTLAAIGGTTVAVQRRMALADYAGRARRDPDVAEAVRRLMSRRAREDGSNVIRLNVKGGRR